MRLPLTIVAAPPICVPRISFIAMLCELAREFLGNFFGRVFVAAILRLV